MFNVKPTHTFQIDIRIRFVQLAFNVLPNSKFDPTVNAIEIQDKATR